MYMCIYVYMYVRVYRMLFKQSLNQHKQNGNANLITKMMKLMDVQEQHLSLTFVLSISWRRKASSSNASATCNHVDTHKLS